LIKQIIKAACWHIASFFLNIVWLLVGSGVEIDI
jgi:hypothetical protein